MTVSKRQILNVRTAGPAASGQLSLPLSFSLSLWSGPSGAFVFVWLRRVKSLHAFGIRQISLISVCANAVEMCITVGYFLKRSKQICLILVCFLVSFGLL